MTRLSDPVFVLDHGYWPQLYAGMALYGIASLLSAASIYVRVADNNRRFLVKRTDRTEGVYMVPHAALIASCFVLFSALLSEASCALFYYNATYNKGTCAGRIIAPLVPWPLWGCVWINLFGPVYAFHLFPADAVQHATSEGTAHYLRFRPRTVNMACYITPLVVAIPTISMSILWGLLYDGGKPVAGQRIYQVLWILWLLVFVSSAVLYCVYSFFLVRILRYEISAIKSVDHVLDEALRRDLGVSPILPFNASEPGIKSRSATPELEAPTEPKRNNLWQAWRPQFNVSPTDTLNAPFKQYSTLGLLRLNTRLIIAETALYTIYCIAWCGASIAKIQIGLAMATASHLLHIVFMYQLWITSAFVVGAAGIMWWRGRSVTSASKQEAKRKSLMPEYQSPLMRLLTPKKIVLPPELAGLPDQSTVFLDNGQTGTPAGHRPELDRPASLPAPASAGLPPKSPAPSVEPQPGRGPKRRPTDNADAPIAAQPTSTADQPVWSR